MTNWFDEAITEKLRIAGNHVILVSALNSNNPLAVDIYDGVTGKILAEDVPEDAARNFVTVWNKLVDAGENTETAKRVNLEWLTDLKGAKQYAN
jgi:hypothetical protein